MKAVLWADTAQVVVMVAGVVAVIIRGCIVSGGIGHVWHTAVEGGRMNLNR